MKFLSALRAAAVVLCLAAGWSAQAQSIFVREECGFSFTACGQYADGVYLTQNGPSVNYQFAAGGDPIFSLSYEGDSFIMAALRPNTIATDGGLPYGLDIYPGSGPFNPPISGCVDCNVTSLAFRSWMNFPTDPFSPMTVALAPIATPVPEPATVLLLTLGLVALGTYAKRSHAQTSLLPG